MREEDLCVIKVGYLEAHFKVYLPRSGARTEFCEDLPRAGETLFVPAGVEHRFEDFSEDFGAWVIF